MLSSSRIAYSIVILTLFLALSLGYPALYLNDEWISANQLNHLDRGEDLLYGYSPYGSHAYAEKRGDVLAYTLALPILSYPAYLLFEAFGDHFRLFVLVLWAALAVALLGMIEFWYPGYARFRGVPWTYGAFFSVMILSVMNAWLYRPFLFVRTEQPYDPFVYPEVAAIVFTNHLAFAVFCAVVFLIGREAFGSDRWGVFSVVSVVASSSYFFWAGNAKEHMLTVLFVAIAAYLFILFLTRGGHEREGHPNRGHSDGYLYLIGSFIAAGWLAWVRPELGLAVCCCLLGSAVVLCWQDGWRRVVAVASCSAAVLLGALPLFVNNYGLTGHPLVPPFALLPSVASGSFSGMVQRQYAVGGSIAADLYRIFIDPVYAGAAGIFQVSPLSFFALLLLPAVLYALYRKTDIGLSPQDRRIVVFFSFLAVALLLAYLRSFPGLGISRGIIPDIRYLCPVYLPMVMLGLYSLKVAGFGAREIGISVKMLIGLAVVNLPLAYVIQQHLWGGDLPAQLAFNQWLVFPALAAAVLVYLLVLAGRAEKRHLAYALPVPLLFSLVWTSVLSFRYATLCWEGYHFWIPVVQYVWYIQYNLFPM